MVIDDLRPATPRAGYPAKATVGGSVPVRATVFTDGHGVVAARALLWAEGRTEPDDVVSLTSLGNDEWAGSVVPVRLGRHRIVVQGWTDRHGTWAQKVRVKLEAGVDVDVEIAEGNELLAASPADATGQVPEAVKLARLALADRTRSADERLRPALDASVAAALSGPSLARDATAGAPRELWVDRQRAAFGAWYELFPRSYGGFAGVEKRVSELAVQGFDVLYLPPVHPIGVSHRKGPNNSLDVAPGDPGSPWAIGSGAGGHTAIDPGLGSFEDFAHLVATVADAGMEVALDYALQCSPDHPWVSEHPAWFHHRPDGSIAYAENPPKKYQDIYPINFWPDDDAERVALWEACKEILDFWIERGINIFRVDNPHTKPIAFWEWLIPAVRTENPEVIFLAEAFTRPKVMAKLAEVGFSQSYTYFTWRTDQHGEEGLVAYFEELAHGPLADYMRPNVWPNTPDILAHPLRNGPPAAFAGRLVLAATLSPSYGIYSGYELYENEPASPANEEYLNSEKYQLRSRDFSRPGTLIPLIGQINSIRRAHPAFAGLRSLRFYPSDNPAIIAYSKLAEDGNDAVLCVVGLDPYHVAETTLHLDLGHLGLPSDRSYYVRDELSDELYLWPDAHPYIRIEPWYRVAHVFDLRVDQWARGGQT